VVGDLIPPSARRRASLVATAANMAGQAVLTLLILLAALCLFAISRFARSAR
jgi:hypothetical protein